MPPMSTRKTRPASATPVTQNGTPKAASSASATELACTMLPMPKPAKPANSAKQIPSHAQFGPMYYIKNGLGPHWSWLGICFALFAGFAGFGIGNMVQANSVADALEAAFGVPFWATGLALAALVGLVLIGGIHRIAAVASWLVPIMAISYVVAGSVVIALNIGAVPEAFRLIFAHAFSPAAATGGFAGAAVWAAIRFGVARGVFSNEAG